MVDADAPVKPADGRVAFGGELARARGAVRAIPWGDLDREVG